ncbi:hypothetical protein GCM10010358_63150 [Streptomyces minutiscleroticus]|uniref:Uncharacterized protein n=1 Tax=Streptomyces minutiscleroticus TaxID=68238 RepID=A0A918U709_9ACTN|nr:hypothetical protein GCM10010358_63150 [Streptomyces minutiscleroticus]
MQPRPEGFPAGAAAWVAGGAVAYAAKGISAIRAGQDKVDGHIPRSCQVEAGRNGVRAAFHAPLTRPARHPVPARSGLTEWAAGLGAWPL